MHLQKTMEVPAVSKSQIFFLHFMPHLSTHLNFCAIFSNFGISKKKNCSSLQNKCFSFSTHKSDAALLLFL